MAGADTDALIAAAEAAADAAGAVIRPLFRRPLGIEAKGDLSPVTIADRNAEAAMRALLSERFADHGILGEEFPPHRPEARRRWVLDPIDGTRAFITGRPLFGTLVGLLEDDRPILGLIDQPVTGERWIGAAGRSTRFRGPFGGTPGCRGCPSLAGAELSCTLPDMLGPEEMPRWQRLAAAVRRVTWGGDCYAYGLLALGHIDVIAEADLKLWDWAALQPVIAGAGGSLTDWEGRALRPNPAGLSAKYRVLAVGDPALLAPAVAILTN
ncbi:MAG: histidinol phosphate phosphatase [Alphaproteobacteria bacterium]|nr:histidinol phosphate phosphatase [Alphaproteobacteria bacterium]